MKKLYLYLSALFIVFLAEGVKAQNVDGDGMFISVTADSIVTCQDDASINIKTCHLGQLDIDLTSVMITNINPFETEISLVHCRVGTIAIDCPDTTLLFQSLPNGIHKFIIKSTVEDCIGGGFFAQDEDTIFIIVNRPAVFNPFVGNEILCENGSFDYFLELDALSGFAEYHWSTGSDGRFLLVQDEGVYSVTVKDMSGCFHSDTVEVVSDCNSNVYIPNSFTPNGDAINDEFRIYGSEIDFDRMMIFNRWGELIFETTSIDTGWGGQNSPIGVYVYRVHYKDSDRVRKKIIGAVSLIR